MLDEMRLEPLGAEALATLVRSVAPEAEPSRVTTQAGGNPLFAIELARNAAVHDGNALPRSLKQLIRDRVERLPANVADALRWASVVGTTFSADRLPAVTGMPFEALTSALEVLERHDFICATEGGDYLFVHELVNRAVYTTLSEPRRRLMHLRIANTLRDQGGGIERLADEIVHHAVLAGENGMAAAACVEAGRRSLRLFANVEAAGFARRGLRHAEALPEPEGVMRRIELMWIALLADRPRDIGEAATKLEALAEAALDHGCADHARIAYETLSLLRWERGFWVDAARDTVRAEMASRNADDGTRALSMAETARCLVMLERDLPKADALLMEASALARRLNMEPATIPDATGMLRVRRGEFDVAVSDFQRARFLARRDGDRITEFFAMEHLAELEARAPAISEAEALATRLSGSRAALAQEARARLPRARGALPSCARATHVPTTTSMRLSPRSWRHADAKNRLSFVLRTAAGLDIARGELRSRSGARRELLALARVINRPSDITVAEAMMAEASRASGAGDIPAVAVAA